MADTVIRPTQKWVRLSYTIWFLLAFVLVFTWNNYLPEKPFWVPVAVIAALWLIWPLRLQIRRRFTKMILEGDKLRLEVGVFSKTTRTLQLSKIQDVSVKQTLTQRLWGVGDLGIETAGESGRMTISDIDQPQSIADQLMDRAREQQPQAKRKEPRD